MATYWKIAAHSAYDMFSWYEYLIFPTSAFGVITPFPDLCLLVPIYRTPSVSEEGGI